MQIIADFTPEELEQDHDVLFLCCHAISRLKMIGSVIQEGCMKIDQPPMDGLRASEVGVMGSIVSDAAEEIEALIEIAQRQWREIGNSDLIPSHFQGYFPSHFQGFPPATATFNSFNSQDQF